MHNISFLPPCFVLQCKSRYGSQLHKLHLVDRSAPCPPSCCGQIVNMSTSFTRWTDQLHVHHHIVDKLKICQQALSGGQICSMSTTMLWTNCKYVHQLYPVDKPTLCTPSCCGQIPNISTRCNWCIDLQSALGLGLCKGAFGLRTKIKF